MHCLCNYRPAPFQRPAQPDARDEGHAGRVGPDRKPGRAGTDLSATGMTSLQSGFRQTSLSSICEATSSVVCVNPNSPRTG